MQIFPQMHHNTFFIRLSALRGGIALLLASTLGAACSSAPPPALSLKEQARKEVAIGSELSRALEAQSHLKSSRELQVYLRDIARKLTEGDPILKEAAVGVYIWSDRSDGIWRDAALPGNKIYLSESLLKTLRFENQVAAAIAFELGHLMRRHALRQIDDRQRAAGLTPGLRETGSGSESDLRGAGDDASAPNGSLVVADGSGRLRPLGGFVSDFFGPAGIFRSDDKILMEATDSAVALLYKAGYDPRGLISIWSRYAENPRHSPYEAGALQRLIDYTREVIARYSPLLNPIVQTPQFGAAQKRIRKL